jgi:hypothetical protein
MANYKQNLHSWLLVSYLQAFTDLWTRRVCRFNFCESGLLDWSDIRHGFCLAHCFVFVIGDSYIKHVGLEFHLGDNYIVFANFTASIGDLMAANWVYWRRNSGASERIFETMKSTIDAVKCSNTIQLSPF